MLKAKVDIVDMLFLSLRQVTNFIKFAQHREVFMQTTQSSPAADELFAQLRKTGHLVDAYSEKWLAEHDDELEGCSQLALVKQKNIELGTDSLNHLLVVYLQLNNKQDMEKRIAAVFPQTSWLTDSSIHQPDFLFINLFTQKILCAGLGKNNRLFVFEAGNRSNELGGPVHLMNKKNKKLFEEFTKLDYASVVIEFLENLEKLGQSNYFLANEWDGDQESDEFMDADEGIVEAMSFFKTFFPTADAGDLDAEMSE